MDGLLITPPLFWLLVGIILSAIELILPKKFANKYKLIALNMGMAAAIFSVLLWVSQTLFNFQWRWVMYEDWTWQIWYWIGLTIAGLVWIRPTFIHRSKKAVNLQTLEAKTLTELEAGEMGRVLYEGSSWQACCQDRDLRIPAGKKVFVLRREGNTLIIAPEEMFDN